MLPALLFATVTAVANGLGALPLAFVKGMTRRWLGISNGIASGLMTAASFGRFYEDIRYGVLQTAAGAHALAVPKG